MKPSEKIEEIITRYVEDAKRKNKVSSQDCVGGFVERREIYMIPAIIEVMDDMAEKTRQAGLGFPDLS